MGKITPFTVEVAEADLADLQDWARNSEQSIGDLLQEALRRYMRHTREDHAELDRRAQGPSYSIEEVEARLRERRRDPQAQAAE